MDELTTLRVTAGNKLGAGALRSGGLNLPRPVKRILAQSSYYGYHDKRSHVIGREAYISALPVASPPLKYPATLAAYLFTP